MFSSRSRRKAAQPTKKALKKDGENNNPSRPGSTLRKPQVQKRSYLESSDVADHDVNGDSNRLITNSQTSGSDNSVVPVVLGSPNTSLSSYSVEFTLSSNKPASISGVLSDIQDEKDYAMAMFHMSKESVDSNSSNSFLADLGKVEKVDQMVKERDSNISGRKELDRQEIGIERAEKKSKDNMPQSERDKVSEKEERKGQKRGNQKSKIGKTSRNNTPDSRRMKMQKREEKQTAENTENMEENRTYPQSEGNENSDHAHKSRKTVLQDSKESKLSEGSPSEITEFKLLTTSGMRAVREDKASGREERMSEREGQEDRTAEGSEASVTSDNEMYQRSDSELETPKATHLSNLNIQQNAARRQRGQAYIGRTYDKASKIFSKTYVEARRLKDRCSCKMKCYKCKEVSDQEREETFKKFWDMTWDAKRMFVRAMVERQTELTKERKRFVYHLNPGSEKIRVCKDMFLNTLDLGEWSVLNWISSESKHPHRRSAHYDRAHEQKIACRQFLDNLSTLPTQSTTKSPLEKSAERCFRSLTDVYKAYKDKCIEDNAIPLCRKTFSQVFTERSVALLNPQKH